MREELRVIEGKEGYRVSSLGKIYSDKSGKWLTNQLSDDGYYKVILRLNGKPYNFRVHRLVAEAFLDAPSNALVQECAKATKMYHGKVLVRHLDNNKLNNRADNLAWGSPADNAADYLLFKAGKEVKVSWKQLELS